MSSQDKAGDVYVSVLGSLFLVLRDVCEPPSKGAVCLRLDTGEVVQMSRSVEDLVRFGWREWEP